MVMCMYVCVHVSCTWVYPSVYMCVCVGDIYIYIYIHVFVDVFAYLFMLSLVCVCVCFCALNWKLTIQRVFPTADRPLHVCLC